MILPNRKPDRKPKIDYAGAILLATLPVAWLLDALTLGQVFVVAAVTGDEADRDVGVADRRRAAGDDDVAEQRDRSPEAGGRTVEPADQRLLQVELAEQDALGFRAHAQKTISQRHVAPVLLRSAAKRSSSVSTSTSAAVVIPSCTRRRMPSCPSPHRPPLEDAEGRVTQLADDRDHAQVITAEDQRQQGADGRRRQRGERPVLLRRGRRLQRPPARDVQRDLRQRELEHRVVFHGIGQLHAELLREAVMCSTLVNDSGAKIMTPMVSPTHQVHHVKAASRSSRVPASSKQATNKAKQTSGTQIPGKTVV